MSLAGCLSAVRHNGKPLFSEAEIQSLKEVENTPEELSRVEAMLASTSTPATTAVDGYLVSTEDRGDIRVRAIHKDGTVILLESDGTIFSEYNPAFAAGKTDEEILQYAYEPFGFTTATSASTPTTSALPATYEAYLQAHPNKQGILQQDISSVYDDIIGQLGKANVFTSGVNKVNALMLSNMITHTANREDMMPSTFWKEHGMSIMAGVLNEGDMAFEQDSQKFKDWSGTNGEVIESEDINDFDFSGPGPFVLRSYHGTTNTFEEFNAALKGNTEGQFGAINYFTSSESDAGDNYAGEGSDLTQRIELKAERLADGLTDFYEEAGTDAEGVAALKERYGEEVYDEDMMVMARNIVRSELHGGDEKVLEVFIRTDKPFVVGEENAPWLEIFDEGAIESQAVARVADNEGLSVEEIEASRDDYQDQIDDARYEIMDEEGNPLISAVQTVAYRYNFDAGDLLSSLYEVSAGSTVSHSALEELLRNDESMVYTESPEDGSLVQSQMIAEVIQELGFDSIIMKNADVRFKNMNMAQGTAHIHVFDANNTNIKSVENAGEFNPNDPNIYHQDSQKFKDWFRGSKVVDAEGKPLVVMHASTYGDITEFNKSEQRFGKAGYGFYFSDASGANLFAEYGQRFQTDRSAAGEQKSVKTYPVYLSLKNPLIVDHVDDLKPYLDSGQKFGVARGVFGNLSPDSVLKLQRMGYDGIITRETTAPKVHKSQGLKILDRDDPKAVSFPVYVAFEPTQIKSAIGNNGEYNPNDPNILFQKGERATPGFYSALARGVEDLQQGKGKADQWSGIISNLKGVKPEEIANSGILEWLSTQEGTITKQQITDFLKAGGVKLIETELSSSTAAPLEWDEGVEDSEGDITYTAYVEMDSGDMVYRIQERGARYYATSEITPYGEKKPITRDLGWKKSFDLAAGLVEATRVATDPETKYHGYTSKGGSNYKELLLQLPSVNPVLDRITQDRFGKNYSELTDAGDRVIVKHEARKNGESVDESGTFKSSHWDQPNIVAHIRFDERTDADGNRVLHIAEVQSDWGQKGRKEGFQPKDSPLQKRKAETGLAYEKIKREVYDLAGEKFTGRYAPHNGTLAAQVGKLDELQAAEQAWHEAEYAARAESKLTPPAPFVTSTSAWALLAMKRAIRYAAENGFQKVTWDEGSVQAERYSLRKQVESLTYSEDGAMVAYDAEGNQVIGKTVPESALADTIGKEAAEKLLAQKPNADGERTLSGQELEVGGEGMVAFYDKMLPNEMNKYLKKWGVKVGRVGLGKRDNAVQAQIRKDIGDKPNAGVRPVPGFDITPKMAEDVMAIGQPLFQKRRAAFVPRDMRMLLGAQSDLSSFSHESAHYYLEVLSALAMKPDASAGVLEDFNKILKWFGIENRNVWDAMTMKEKEPYHEQWAESYERYLIEGQAPSIELRPVFARVRAWMLSVYKSLAKFIEDHPASEKLNDEVRAVFDRLLASEEAIKQAESLRGYEALFKNAGEAGVTAEEFAGYLREHTDATNEAITLLASRSMRDMKWASNAKNKVLKELQAQADSERAQIKAEVTKQVAEEPIEQAKKFIKTGEGTLFGEEVKAEVGHKLNTAILKEMYPASGLVKLDLGRLQGMTNAEGLDPDVLAPAFGFASGDALVQELMSGESTLSKIDGLTDKRMLEEHGDLIDPQAMNRAADAAIHNEVRARFMATGLTILDKKGIPVNALNKAAKVAAENAIAEKKVRDLRPMQYTIAESKAGAEAVKLAVKDPEGAIRAQRTALLNNRMAKAAQDAQEEIIKAVKYLDKFTKVGVRKTVDTEYLEQIHELLAPFNLQTTLSRKEIDKRSSLADFVKAQEAAGYQPAIDETLIERALRKSYKDMTVSEVRALLDTVKQIEHLGRLKTKLLTAKDARDFAARMGEAKQSIEDNANRVVPERETPTDVLGKTAKLFRWLAASHRKFASFLREMDGGKDNGVMFNLLLRGMMEAGNLETEIKSTATKRMAKLFNPILDALSAETVAGNLYARKKLVPGTNLSMTHEQRIMFGMNWGNEGNRQRLLDGGITGNKAISTVQAQRVLDTLTKAEWDFIQGTWDFIGEFKTQIAAQEKALTGVEPKWVEPSPIVTKHGTYRGGYFPAKYDTNLSTRSDTLEAVTDLRMGMKGAFGASSARNGYAKERAAAVINRPLLLSFGVVGSHVGEVAHRLAWQSWLIDASRTLKALDAPIRAHYGVEVLKELKDTVRDIATGDAPATTPTERLINRIRTGSSIVGMGWGFATALMQPAGIAQSWERVGGSWIAKGVAQFVAHPFETSEWVNEKSSLMRHRGETMYREINEIINTVRSGEKVSSFQASFFWAIGKMQRSVDIPTWIGAYEKGLAQLKYENATDAAERDRIEKHAVSLADQAVVDSQSGGQIQDLASVQRGGPLQKLFTNFYSYFSALYNRNVELYRKTHFTDPLEVAAFASDAVMLNAVPVLFALALKELLKGECKWDAECLAEKYAHDQLNNQFAQMILLREVGTAIDVAAGGSSFGYSGPAGLRFFSDLYKTGQQVQQGEFDLAAFKAANSTVGAVLHYPAGQINKTVDGIVAIENGETEGVGGAAAALIAGKPK